MATCTAGRQIGRANRRLRIGCALAAHWLRIGGAEVRSERAAYAVYVWGGEGGGSGTQKREPQAPAKRSVLPPSFNSPPRTPNGLARAWAVRRRMPRAHRARMQATEELCCDARGVMCLNKEKHLCGPPPTTCQGWFDNDKAAKRPCNINASTGAPVDLVCGQCPRPEHTPSSLDLRRQKRSLAQVHFHALCEFIASEGPGSGHGLRVRRILRARDTIGFIVCLSAGPLVPKEKGSYAINGKHDYYTIVCTAVGFTCKGMAVGSVGVGGHPLSLNPKLTRPYDAVCPATTQVATTAPPNASTSATVELGKCHGDPAGAAGTETRGHRSSCRAVPVGRRTMVCVCVCVCVYERGGCCVAWRGPHCAASRAAPPPRRGHGPPHRWPRVRRSSSSAGAAGQGWCQSAFLGEACGRIRPHGRATLAVCRPHVSAFRAR